MHLPVHRAYDAIVETGFIDAHANRIFVVLGFQLLD